MMDDRKDQYRAFVCLVIAALIIALAPIAVSGILGRSLPDALIATSDKAVTGFIALLGTVGGLMFRQNSSDRQATENTGKAFDAIRTAQGGTDPPDVTLQPGQTAQAADDR